MILTIRTHQKHLTGLLSLGWINFFLEGQTLPLTLTFGDGVCSRNGDPFFIHFLYSKIAGEFTFLNFDFVGKIKHEWKQKPISFQSLCLGLCLTEVQLSGGRSLYNEIVVKLWLLLLGWETADRFSSPLPTIGSSQFGLMWCVYSSFIQQIPIQLLLLTVTEGNIFRARYL